MTTIYPNEFPAGTILRRGERQLHVMLDQAIGRLAFGEKAADGSVSFRRGITPDPRATDEFWVKYPTEPVELAPWVYQPVSVVDLETTGIGPDDKIVEIAIVTMRFGQIIDKWSTLVNPGRPIPLEAIAVHGITDEMVATAPTFDQIRAEVQARLTGVAAVIGYHIFGADEPWLAREGVTIASPIVDPLVIVRTKAVGKHWKGDYQPLPDADCVICGSDDEEPKPKRKAGGRHRLERAARELGCAGPVPGMATEMHRALWDAYLAGAIMWVLRGEVGYDARVTETYLRAEGARQEAELQAYKAKKQAEEQDRRTTRKMLVDRVAALEARLAKLEER